MSKRMKRAMTAITLTIGLTLILSFSILPIDTTKQFDISEYSYEADFSVELEHMPVVAQQTGYTCYAVSMVIVRTYLGLETTENSLLTDFGLQDRGSGMIPREYLPLAQEALGALSYSITLSNAKSETEILNLITGSLTEGLPVIIYYSTLDDWNKPRYYTHYGVIYGVDMERPKERHLLALDAYRKDNPNSFSRCIYSINPIL